MSQYVMSVVFLIDIAGAVTAALGSSCLHGAQGHPLSSRSSDSSLSSLLISGGSHRTFVLIYFTLEFIPTYINLALA